MNDRNEAVVHRCCQTTVNDLRAAHKRNSSLELQALLLSEHNDGLTTALAEETAGRLADRNRYAAVVADLEQQLREALTELGAVTQDRDNWRTSNRQETAA